MVALLMGIDLIRYRKMRFVRQIVTSMMFTSLIFTLAIMNLSFTMTLNEAQDKLNMGLGPIVITKDEIRFMLPPDRWVWNATQAVVDDATLILANKLGVAFTIITLVIAGLTFGHETSKSYAESKRDNEEHRPTMGTMYALGARPSRIYGAFMTERALSLTIGYFAGLVVSIFALLPVLMNGLSVFDWIGISNTAGGLFFRKFDYPIASLAAATFVVWIATVKSMVLSRGLRRSALQEATREATQ